MFNILIYLPYKTFLIPLVFGVAFTAGSAPVASSTANGPSSPDKEKNSCGITIENIQKKQKQIAGIKAQCKKDYERVQSFCTERGLAAIQTISIGGQAVANAINILKSNEKPESAKKAMGISKNLSYGLGALNAGVGAKCLSNIRSCSSSCESAEKTKECLETFKDTMAATAANPAAAAAAANTAESLIAKLNKVDGHSLACKQLKSNAYAALAQGALHGATGLIQAEMEKSLGKEVEEEDSAADKESEAFNPPEEPTPPETPTLSGEPGVNLNDSGTTDSANEVGEFAGNQIHKNPSENEKDSSNDISEGYRSMGSVPETAETSGGAPYGYSGGSVGNIPFSSGGQGIGSDNLHGEEEETESYGKDGGGGAGSFAATPFTGGGSGGGGDHYGGGDDGYYEEEEPVEEEGLVPEEEKTEEEEESEQLRKSIGGKHESIFEKASKVLANYCMEGPLKCE